MSIITKISAKITGSVSQFSASMIQNFFRLLFNEFARYSWSYILKVRGSFLDYPAYIRALVLSKHK